ncbi:MAG: adenylate kinase family protein [Halodesulfurarchaeum sp.]
MRVAVTGTPGTGKTAATDRLQTDLSVIHLNDVIRAEELYTDVDETRDSVVADLDAVREWLAGREDVIVESHLAHHVDADRVIVLRCHPTELVERLVGRGEPRSKAEENAESEALDVILAEAVQRHGRDAVYEIDTTERDIGETAAEIERVLDGTRDPSAGTVDFTNYL